MVNIWNEKYGLWTTGKLSDLELHCLKKGYFLSEPIGVKESTLAFVAIKDDAQGNVYGIIFLNKKTIGITPEELDYRISYPHIKYYRKIIMCTPVV